MFYSILERPPIFDLPPVEFIYIKKLLCIGHHGPGCTKCTDFTWRKLAPEDELCEKPKLILQYLQAKGHRKRLLGLRAAMRVYGHLN